MSIFTGLTTPHKLAGVFGLSSYLLLGHKVKELAEENGNVNKEIKWFMGHGDVDPLVKYQWGLSTAETLRRELGVGDLDFQTYHGLAHSADPLEIDHLEGFIRRCLPSLGEKDGGAGGGEASGESEALIRETSSPGQDGEGEERAVEK